MSVVVKKQSLILVVDDEWMNREMMQAYLESEGYEVALAHSGEQALEMLASRLPDLILTDVRMQGLNGYEVCARIKADPVTARIPVLLVTGMEREEDKRKGIAVGAEDFVSKPLDALVMLNRVKTLVRLKQLYDRLDAQEAAFREAAAPHVDASALQEIMDKIKTSQIS